MKPAGLALLAGAAALFLLAKKSGATPASSPTEYEFLTASDGTMPPVTIAVGAGVYLSPPAGATLTQASSAGAGVIQPTASDQAGARAFVAIGPGSSRIDATWLDAAGATHTGSVAVTVAASAVA